MGFIYTLIVLLEFGFADRPLQALDQVTVHVELQPRVKLEASSTAIGAGAMGWLLEFNLVRKLTLKN
jgi:hypothetical protein